MQRAVVVMGKLPELGRVKTRLARPELAVRLYRAFLAEVFALVDRAHAGSPGFDRVFACAAESLEDARALAPPAWRVVLQRGAGLGERIEAAREDAEAEAVAIIGSDAPAMRPERILEAFAKLEAHDAVLGPTADGGYDLIAFARPCPALLEGVPWSTDQVMAVTRARAAAAGLSIAELDEGYDIDEPRDLERALADPHLSAGLRALILEVLASPDRGD